MDRLFGKELSNLLDPLPHINRFKPAARVPSKSIRLASHDENLAANKRAEKVSVSAHQEIKPLKVEGNCESEYKEDNN